LKAQSSLGTLLMQSAFLLDGYFQGITKSYNYNFLHSKETNSISLVLSKMFSKLYEGMEENSDREPGNFIYFL